MNDEEARAFLNVAAALHKVEPGTITNRDRRRKFSAARAMCAWTWREAGMSLPEIARRLGRHHTTVIHLLRAHAWRAHARRERAAGLEPTPFKVWEALGRPV